MKNGYEVLWTNHALQELNETFEYLELNWTLKEIQKFAFKTQNKLDLISKNPFLFQKWQRNEEVRKAVIDKNNVLYFRIKDQTVQILSAFSTKKKPFKVLFI